MITKEQYGEWRNHPATLFFRQFLKDQRETLIQRATESWLNKSDFGGDLTRGYITALFEISDIPFETIETFYESKIAESKEG